MVRLNLAYYSRELGSKIDGQQIVDFRWTGKGRFDTLLASLRKVGMWDSQNRDQDGGQTNGKNSWRLNLLSKALFWRKILQVMDAGYGCPIKKLKSIPIKSEKRRSVNEWMNKITLLTLDWILILYCGNCTKIRTYVIVHIINCCPLLFALTNGSSLHFQTQSLPGGWTGNNAIIWGKYVCVSYLSNERLCVALNRCFRITSPHCTCYVLSCNTVSCLLYCIQVTLFAGMLC